MTQNNQQWIDKVNLSRLALKIVLMARQEAIVKRVWGILLFFTQIGFIVFTHHPLIQNYSWYWSSYFYHFSF
jgi:hypothetical protein